MNVLITANEAAALEACLNYERREDQLADNHSVGDAATIAAAIGGSLQAAGGVMTSLTEKGLGFIDEEGLGIFWLTEDGVNAIFDWIDAMPAVEAAKAHFTD